jgi:hypothetical protein
MTSSVALRLELDERETELLRAALGEREQMLKSLVARLPAA